MANTNPIFANTPKIGSADLSAANTNLDGTGTLVDLFTAGSSGSRVERITVKATGTTTAGMVRIFVFDGSTNRLYEEIAVTAATPNASTKSFRKDFSPGIILPTGYKLKASTHNAEAFKVTAEGGDF